MDGTVLWLNDVADVGIVPRMRRALGSGVDRRLVPGEHVVDEIRHHWVAFCWPSLVLLLAALLAVRSLVVVPVDVLWVPLVVVAVLLVYGSDRFLRAWKDRFLITDSRVMRISGVYSRKAAWMPLGRVLDITVDRPFWLRPLRAGHLVLENAAQEQGLREVRYIPHPSERALLIHALRTGVAPQVAEDHPKARRVPDHPAYRGDHRHGHHLA